MKTFVIVNPASSGGATDKGWPVLEGKLQAKLPVFDYALTQCPGDGTRLARKALLEGYERIIAVGGDGTVNEVVNGFFEDKQLIVPHVQLGVIDSGTGGDFRKNIGLGESHEEQIAAIAAGHTKKLTLGCAHFADAEGQPQSRYFVVICSFGISSAVSDYVNKSLRLKRYGSEVAFALAALKMIFTYKNVPIRVTLDDKTVYQGPLMLGSSCNGPRTGGGMLMAPGADSFSGQLDFVIGGDLNLYERLMVFPRIYNGTHINQAKVDYLGGRRLEVEPLEDSRIVVDMDGDVVGYLPLTIEAYGAALDVLAPCTPV